MKEIMNLLGKLKVKSEYEELHEDAQKMEAEMLKWCRRALQAEALLSKKNLVEHLKNVRLAWKVR